MLRGIVAHSLAMTTGGGVAQPTVTYENSLEVEAESYGRTAMPL